MPENSNSDKFIVIGEVSGVYGVKGQLKIYSFTEPQSSFLDYKKFYWNKEGSWQLMPLVKNSLKEQGGTILVNLDGLTDRDIAKEYKSIKIAILREDLPELDQNQYYWTDLEGLDVYTVFSDTEEQSDIKAEKYLGVVDHLIETGSNDVLVIKDHQSNSNGSIEYLVPYILDKYILSIDLTNNKMIVDWDPEF